MARKLVREEAGKSSSGRYSEQFKKDVLRCIAKGLNSSQAAEELGIEPLGSGYRQLYYKLSREYKEGQYLPVMRATGVGETVVTQSSGIKNEGADISDITPKVKDSSNIGLSKAKAIRPVVKKTIEPAKVEKPSPKLTINSDKHLDVNSDKVKKEEPKVITESPKPVINKSQPIVESAKPTNSVVKKSENTDTSSKSSLINTFAKEFEDYKNSPNVTVLESKINEKISSLETAIQLKQQEIDEMREMVKFLDYIRWEISRG